MYANTFFAAAATDVRGAAVNKLAFLPARAVEPSEFLKVYLLRIDTTSLAGNKYILLDVDKA